LAANGDKAVIHDNLGVQIVDLEKRVPVFKQFLQLV